MHPRHASHRAPAFTLVELLVVVGIIVLLVGLLFVSLAQFYRHARQTACLSKQRQIALASAAYAADSDGRFPSPRTDARACAAAPFTMNSWVDTAAAGGFVNGIETTASLEAGRLWNYLNADASAYKSPQDWTDAFTRVRSYSLNAFVGVGERNYNARANDNYDFPSPDHPQTPAAQRGKWFNTTTLAQIPQPARTMCSISEEDSAGYNTHGWIIALHPSDTHAGFGQWLDSPALWNGSRVNISNLDGSIEALDILYDSLREQFESQASSHGLVEGGTRPAFKAMADRMLPGIIDPALQ